MAWKPNGLNWNWLSGSQLTMTTWGFQLQREGDGQGRVAVLVKVDVKDSGVRRISWLHRRLSSNHHQLTGGWVTQGGSRLGTLPQERICSNSAKRLSIVKVQSDSWEDYFTSMEREKGRIAVILGPCGDFGRINRRLGEILILKSFNYSWRCLASDNSGANTIVSNWKYKSAGCYHWERGGGIPTLLLLASTSAFSWSGSHFFISEDDLAWFVQQIFSICFCI